MGEGRLAGEVLAGSEQDRGHERRHAGVDVDDGPAREVEGSHPAQEPSAPDAVRDGGIDEERPEGDEEEIGGKAHPLHDGARDQGGRDDGERRLERHEEEMGNRGGVGRGRQVDAAQQRVGQPAGEGSSRGKREGVAQGRPREADEAERHDAHHHRVQGVLRADESSVEEGEGGGHEKNEGGRDEHPGNVGSVHAACLRCRY